MSKKINNITETHKKSTILFTGFLSLAIFISLISGLNKEHLSQNIIIALSILVIILSLVSIWFGIKMIIASISIGKDKKLLKQLSDERAVEIDYKSRARGYLGSTIFAAFYILIASIQKALFGSNYLFEIDGFYIALLVMAIGGIVTMYSANSMDKE